MNNNSRRLNTIPLSQIKKLFPDISSGFIVFLLALPLSLGIAKASEFPPIMGLITAIVGGVIVSFLMGSRLSIKGPAAGLIVIVAGSVEAFGGGEVGWKLTLGAIFVASILQIIFGLLKLGKFVDFFPIAAIHGMLAAIGIIIIAKQIPVLLNIDPIHYSGKSPITLLTEVLNYFSMYDSKGGMIGLTSLFILLAWPFLKKTPLSSIPAPMVVLAVAIPLGIYFSKQLLLPDYTLVQVGDLWQSLGIHVDFSGVFNWIVFLKYVVMFALVGSLESLLTVKAIDIIDPLKEKSNTNKDLMAIGIGNALCAVVGGLPMISEVARSSANVHNGAQSKWSNFFHGLFIFVFLVFAVDIIELIPNAALAAMLIAVGIKLAHPKEFIHMWHIGKAQLAIFVTTIIFTLYEDLLVGIAMGILLKLVIHYINGLKPKYTFKSPIAITELTPDEYAVSIEKAAVFTNFLGIKSNIDSIPKGKKIIIDLSKTNITDHTVLDNLEQFKSDYEKSGGQVLVLGLESHKSLSSHALAVRIKKS